MSLIVQNVTCSSLSLRSADQERQKKTQLNFPSYNIHLQYLPTYKIISLLILPDTIFSHGFEREQLSSNPGNRHEFDSFIIRFFMDLLDLRSKGFPLESVM